MVVVSAVKLGWLFGVMSAVSACRSAQPLPMAAGASHDDQASVRKAEAALVSKDWRFFTTSFAVMRSDGYPIRFLLDGTVETQNLAFASRWIVTEGDTLELKQENGETLLTFHGDRMAGMYWFRHPEGYAKGQLILIGLAGSDFHNYQPPEGARTGPGVRAQ